MARKGGRIPAKTKAAMLADLKAGMGCDEIAVNHGVGRQSVFTLREKHRDELPDWKRRTAAGVMAAAEKIVNRINCEAESKNASLKDLSICAGILISKQGELSGSPSQVLEVRHEIGQGLHGWLQDRPENTAPGCTVDAEIVEIQGKDGGGDCLENSSPKKPEPPASQGGGGGEKSPRAPE